MTLLHFYEVFFTIFFAVMEFNALARLKQYDVFSPNEAPTTQKKKKKTQKTKSFCKWTPADVWWMQMYSDLSGVLW